MNLLYEASDSRFVTRKSRIFNDQPNVKYSVGNNSIYSTKAFKSNLCDYSDAYILVNDDITVTNVPTTQVAFKNCAPYTKCITKIDGAIIDVIEELDLVVPMYNLVEYSPNYTDTTGSLWFYSEDEATDIGIDIENTDDFKSFKYKAKLLGNTVAANQNNRILENGTIAVPLKYLINFWRSLQMPLINFKI